MKWRNWVMFSFWLWTISEVGLHGLFYGVLFGFWIWWLFKNERLLVGGGRA